MLDGTVALDHSLGPVELRRGYTNGPCQEAVR